MSATDAAPQPLGGVVIGLGKLGLLHAGIVNALQGVSLVGIAERDAKVVQMFRNAAPDLQVVKDAAELLDQPGVDFAVIATPTGSHVDLALQCVARGLPFFMEKPLSVTAAQARPLLTALSGDPVVNMVGYMTRHQPPFVKAHEIARSGALGKPQLLRSSMYAAQLFQRGKGWRYDRSISGGGVLATQNTHLVDLLVWLFGDIVDVTAHAHNLYSDSVEDYVHAFMNFASGLVGYLDASWSSRHFRAPTINIHVQGENGTLDISDDRVALHLLSAEAGYPAGWSSWSLPDLYQGVSFDIGGPHYTLQAEEFVAAVRGGDAVSSDVASAYRTQCVVDAIYRSALEAGRSVSIAGDSDNG